MFAVFFVLIAAGTATALILGAALAGAALLALTHAPGFGVWHIESKAIMQSLAGAPGVPAPRIHHEEEKKAFEPSLTSPPPRLIPAI